MLNAGAKKHAGRQQLVVPSTIAIDGPAATGKSTVGALLADRLGYMYFDTGVMYRAVTWAALSRGIAIEDEAGMIALAEELVIDVDRPSKNDGRQYTVLADGQDVTWQIREPAVDGGVSLVSTYPGVRYSLTAQQRRIASGGQIVMVGRDIGTVVMPDAELKIYLDASIEERVRRRYQEVMARGDQTDHATIVESVRLRDRIDSGRVLAPLVAAPDAVVIDTTDLGVAQVLEWVCALIETCDDPE
jgi:cytidylate kinase